MARIFTTLILILMILLFPPAVLAVISNDAVPGQPMYPIKRGLEWGILKIASVHPTTLAMFSTERSDRRFAEATILISLSKEEEAKKSLNELLIQTRQAAAEIKRVEGDTSKTQLKNKLTNQIKKYDVKLEQIKQDLIQQSGTPTPTPTPTAIPGTPDGTPAQATPTQSTSTPSPTPTVRRVTPVPTKIQQGQPTPTTRVVPTPTTARSRQLAPTATIQPSPALVAPTPLPPDDSTEEPCPGSLIDVIGCTQTGIRPFQALDVPGNSGGTSESSSPNVQPSPTPTDIPTHRQRFLNIEPPVIASPTATPQPIDCTVCDADVVNTGGGRVDSYDMAAVNSCASHTTYAQTPVYGSACSKMDKNGNGKIDQEEVDCANSKFGQICVP